RPSDWDAQGEFIRSRLRDSGFYGADLWSEESTPVLRTNPCLVSVSAALPDLSAYQAVVLTRPCMRHLSAEQASKVARWVNSGGVLVIDGYCATQSDALCALIDVSGPVTSELHVPSYQDATRVTCRVAFAPQDPIFDGMNVQH